MKGLPDFLIIGPSRCGTTSLHFQLKAHVDLVAPKYDWGISSKEVHFFDNNWTSGIEWYMDHWPQPKEKDKLYFESTPDYIFEPETPTRVKAWMPDCRFIVMLRNPVERAWSHYYFYWMRFYGATIDYVFNALDNVTPEMPEKKKFPINNESHYRILQCGMYAKMLSRWFKEFPRDRFFIIHSESYFMDPAGTVDAVLDFLGACSMRLSEYLVFDPLKNRPGEDYPPVPAELRKRLESFYRPLNERLYLLLGWEALWR